jgi:hypothetical protein
VSTPLKNDGVRQLGLLFPIYGNIKMFQSTNQIHMSIVFLFGTFNPIAKPSFSRSMVSMITMVLEDLTGKFW